MKNFCYIITSCCDRSKDNINALKRNVKFEAAPEPEDVIFENLELSQLQRLLRIIGIYIISLIICGVSLGIIVGFNKYKNIWMKKVILIISY